MEQVPKARRPNTTPHASGRKRLPLGKILIIAVAVLLVYGIGSWAYGALSVVNVNGATPLTVTNKTSLFSLSGTEYAASLVQTQNNNYAQISITKLPIFINPTYYVSVYENYSTNVNTTGHYANLQVAFGSAASGSAVVILTPVPTQYKVRPNSTWISEADTGLQPVSTTSIVVAVTSQSTTSIPTTTSIGQGSSPLAIAQYVLSKSAYYSLLANYTRVFANDTQCTPKLYNSTYQIAYGHLPYGPNTYANASVIVPYAINLTFTKTSSSTYNAVYSVKTKLPGLSGPGLVIVINTTSETLVSATTEGIYKDLTYSDLLSGYESMAKVANVCAPLITLCLSPSGGAQAC